MNTTANLILLLSAPSGAGKTTVSQALLRDNPGLRRVITCATRAPRPGERDGVDYHFFSQETFAQLVADGQFLEHARVFGEGKGILKDSVRELLDAGRDVLLNVDVQGAETVRRVSAIDPTLAGRLVTVFLTPPTPAELETRLRGRGADPDDAIARRSAEAGREVARWREFDYLILSETREADLRRLQAIYDAEKLRVTRLDLSWTAT
jgi:guanylate kinase